MWWILILAVVLFIAVVLVRTLRFKPPVQARVQTPPAPVDPDKAVRDLADMVRCKTVSYYDRALIDEAEFEKFRALLAERFPAFHAACTRRRIKTGVLYCLEGERHDAPTVFMAHYDVVPVNAEAWDKPPFDGVIEDGVLWGRGTLDTKGTLNGAMQAAETLITGGFKPKRDVYFAFGADEEISGETAPAMVDWFQSQGIAPGLVLDEGGAVVEDIFPGVTRPGAVIGIAEKGLMNAEFLLESTGGHASAPPRRTTMGAMARAVLAVEARPFKRRLTRPIAEMFDTLGRCSSFSYRMLFANLWCFMPVLDMLCKKAGGELNAMLRTTCVFTQAEGSSANNVMPPFVRFGANLRLISGDTTESAVADLKARAGNPDVQITCRHGMNPSKISETKGPAWDALCRAVSQTWPEAIVTPYLMLAASDARHYCRICDHVYRFNAMALSKEERGTIHANNERIPVSTIVKTAEFYYRLMKTC